MIRKTLLTGLSILTLSGCANLDTNHPSISAKPLPSRLDEIAYVNTLRSAFEVVKAEQNELSLNDLNCFKGAELAEFKAHFAEGYREGKDPVQYVHDSNGNAVSYCVKFRVLAADDAHKETRRQTLDRYLQAGYGLTDIYCQRFFTVANASQRNRDFLRSEAVNLDTLMGAVLGVSGASKRALTISNSLFGFAGKSLEGYDNAYLVAPDMPDVERLVAAEQSAFRQEVRDRDEKLQPQTYEQARNLIEAYARTCSYSGMRQLVSKSIKDRTETMNKDTTDKQNGTSLAGDEKSPGQTDAGKSGSGQPTPTPTDQGFTRELSTVPPA